VGLTMGGSVERVVTTLYHFFCAASLRHFLGVVFFAVVYRYKLILGTFMNIFLGLLQVLSLNGIVLASGSERGEEACLSFFSFVVFFFLSLAVSR